MEHLVLYVSGIFLASVFAVFYYVDSIARFRQVQDRNWRAEREDRALKNSPFRDFSDHELDKLKNVEDPEMPELCVRLHVAIDKELQKRKERKKGES